MLRIAFWQIVLILSGFHRISFADSDDFDENDEAVSVPAYGRVFTLNEASIEARKDSRRNINCDNFSDYAQNCTTEAAGMYNSNKKSPPMPQKIRDWCQAVKYLTNCALEWNLDCREVTDSHFNEESINGHSYVVHHICDDEQFLESYNETAECVEGTSDGWELCYTTFKNLVDGFKKNTSSEWTHFETHFYLCCGRAKFRRCVLDTTGHRSDVCTRSQAMVLQKFSVIVSEGDVYQDCDFNMMYQNCPGGDPRPTSEGLTRFAQDNPIELREHAAVRTIDPVLSCLLAIFVFCNILFL